MKALGLVMLLKKLWQYWKIWAVGGKVIIIGGAEECLQTPAGNLPAGRSRCGVSSIVDDACCYPAS